LVGGMYGWAVAYRAYLLSCTHKQAMYFCVLQAFHSELAILYQVSVITY
jgi:hypothetical protein